MKRLRMLNLAIAVAAAAILSSPCRAQTSTDSAGPSSQATPLPATSSGASYPSRPLPQVETVIPFSLNPLPSQDAHLIEYLSEGQMSQGDRELAAKTQSSIREAATDAGFEFDNAGWTYQQLACQALPGYVFLLFKWNRGAGDVSLFSAAIPRSGAGRVRIIPIERRGYSLFSPASVNVLSIATFNRIRAGEPANQSVDWLATALCYAALTGAHPQSSPLAQKTLNPGLSLSFPPKLEVQGDGDSTVRFVDVSAAPQPQEWTLTFNAKGQLLKVHRFPMPAFAVTSAP